MEAMGLGQQYPNTPAYREERVDFSLDLHYMLFFFSPKIGSFAEGSQVTWTCCWCLCIAPVHQ